MALFCGELLLSRNTGDGTAVTNAMGVVGLAVFAWSVVFGRLYTGMVRFPFFAFPIFL
jgi:hypothetical protein